MYPVHYFKWKVRSKFYDQLVTWMVMQINPLQPLQ